MHAPALLPAARFVAKWEGFSSPAILDTWASPAVWTFGFGHTRYAGRPFPGPGSTISKARAYLVLANDLRASARKVNHAIKHKLTIRQRMALISFVYNLGDAYLDDGIQQACNRGRFAEAGRLMLNYDHAGGVRLEGLTRRRHAEAWMMAHSKKASPPRKGDQTHAKAHRKGR